MVSVLSGRCTRIRVTAVEPPYEWIHVRREDMEMRVEKEKKKEQKIWHGIEQLKKSGGGGGEIKDMNPNSKQTKK